MLTSNTLQFLYDLSQHNNRDWFEKNKPRYEAEVKKPFEATVAAVIEQIYQFEPSFRPMLPKHCIFRIYRDTRFSADKTPYKNHLGAFFAPKGNKATDDMNFPGYYLHLEFGNLMIGGGAYNLDKPALHKVRTAILQDPEAFRDVLHGPDFVAHYGDIKGERNKVLPPEFKEAAKQEPLLYQKQFYFMAEMDSDVAIRPDFPDFVANYFRAGKPLNDYCRSVMV